MVEGIPKFSFFKGLIHVRQLNDVPPPTGPSPPIAGRVQSTFWNDQYRRPVVRRVKWPNDAKPR